MKPLDPFPKRGGTLYLGAHGPPAQFQVGQAGLFQPLVEEFRNILDQHRDVDGLEVARDLRSKFSNLLVVVVGSTEEAEDYVRISIDDNAMSSVPASAVSKENQLGPFEVTKLVVTSGSTGVPKVVERPEQQ